MKRAFLDTPDGQIHYRQEGSGEPLVLLHQTPRSTDEYAEVIPIFARKYRVIAMDTIGYGDSDKPPRQYSIEDYARTVVMLLDSLKIRKASLLGHHTGAFIALEVAAAYPQRVEKLVLSGPFYMDEGERQRQEGKWPQWEVKEDGSHLMELWQSRIAWAEDPHLANRMVLEILKAGDKTEYGHWAFFKYRMEGRLPLVQCPTLVMWGTKDLKLVDSLGIRASENRHKVKEAIHRSKVVEIQGGSIPITNQMPREFAKAVLNFLENPGI